MKKDLKKIFFPVAVVWIFAPLGALAQLDLTTNYGLPRGSIFVILDNLLLWLLGILGIVAIIAFVISGIIYLVSAGDDNTITRAKTAMTWSIIGVIVGLGGFIVVQAVFRFLNAAPEF